MFSKGPPRATTVPGLQDWPWPWPGVQAHREFSLLISTFSVFKRALWQAVSSHGTPLPTVKTSFCLQNKNYVKQMPSIFNGTLESFPWEKAGLEASASWLLFDLYLASGCVVPCECIKPCFLAHLINNHRSICLSFALQIHCLLFLMNGSRQTVAQTIYITNLTLSQIKMWCFYDHGS